MRASSVFISTLNDLDEGTYFGIGKLEVTLSAGSELKLVALANNRGSNISIIRRSHSGSVDIDDPSSKIILR